MKYCLTWKIEGEEEEQHTVHDSKKLAQEALNELVHETATNKEFWSAFPAIAECQKED